jgi:hypothetical protein
MADIDDGSITNDARLLRRIRPDQIVDDDNLGGRRPSSAAFKAPELSVDAEPLLIAADLNWKFSLQGHQGYSLAQFAAGHARAVQLPVIHRPLPANNAHTEVHGKKTKGIANHLLAGTSWVHLQP